MMRVPVLAFLVVTATAEKGCQKDIPIWRGKVYVGNSIEGTIERRQVNEVIQTTSSDFDEFICVRRKSFDCFFETYIVNAKGWRKQSACGLEEEP